MFLRSIHRKKGGKDHPYFSIVENHRIASGKTVQRTVLYLGEINDQQPATWRKTLSVFDDEQQEYANLSLFPDDREIPVDAVDSLQRWLILPCYTQPSRDTKLLNREAEIAFAQPTATATCCAKRELRNRSTDRPVGGAVCGEDLSLTSPDSKVLNRLRDAQLRKSG